MYRIAREGWMKHVDFLLLNQICLHVSFMLAYCLRMGWDQLPYMEDSYLSIAIFLSAADLLVAVLMGTLHDVLRRGYYQELAATFKHTLMVFLLMVLYMFSMKISTDYSRIVTYLTMGFYLLSNYGARVLWKKAVSDKRRMKEISLLIVTDQASAQGIITDVREKAHDRYRLSGLAILGNDGCMQEIEGIPVVEWENVAAFICREWIDEVLIDLSDAEQRPTELMDQCREMGVTVHTVLNEPEGKGQKQIVENLAGHMVLTSSINLATPMQAFLKRGLDIAGGLIGTLLAGVALLVVGPGIYRQSPGPVVFSQERIGKNGKKFKFYKIRSMYMDAEERKQELMKDNRVKDGMMFKLDFDPRIIGNELLPDGTKKTGIGEKIRSTSLDELPQFWNVLKGDMSLVGPRPPTVDEWEKYKLHHRARLAMKPGITGMWQVSGRSTITDFEEVVKLDTDYICNWSLGLDLRILFQTIGAVLNKTGAM